jgi:hypothetical protein
MKTLFVRTAGALVCALAINAPSYAHADEQDRPTPAPREAATPAADPPYVDFKGFSTKMFRVVNRDPRQLVPALRLLGSGFKGAQIESSTELRTITVRDFPENVASIEEAIKVLDKPEPARPTIELKLHVLVASDAEGDGATAPELEPVIRQLRQTLKFKGYTLVTTILQRAQSGAFQVATNGVAKFNVLPSGNAVNPDVESYDLRVEQIALADEAPQDVRLRKLAFRIHNSNRGQITSMQTDLNVRDGEQVVVGTAALQDKGLILVLSAKVVK